uniref:UDP-N-acetylglucosamine--dolichyl-phosphate N-acetylglucosaminephosphotransferase n=2 Tax=Lutzomyia longipalpis TaxID=7200 RepID=A0A7G3AIS8_LUTLO
MFLPLAINTVLSVIALVVTNRLIPRLKDMFIQANVFGIDMSKKERIKIPESMGVVTASMFLVVSFLFIPVPFMEPILGTSKAAHFPHNEFVELISALLSICCMILLGFADDVLDLRWRIKLLLPTFASLPLLMVYYVNFNSTTVIMPNIVRPFVGDSLDIGFLYYIYMGMLAVFCTNAINILAGINGLEVGQSLIIAVSIVIFNCLEIFMGRSDQGHSFSLYMLLPYIGTTYALWLHNKYPSKVFVGDTFCYFSGMTFAVVGILGHFSKTVLLFFIPQVINFLYSVPQLFHFIPCPRHRLPKYNSTTDKLDVSETQFRYNQLHPFGKVAVSIFKHLRLIKWEVANDGVVRTNNFTLINFVILKCGPMREDRVTWILMGFQVVCTCVAFMIRYPLAGYFYKY